MQGSTQFSNLRSASKYLDDTTQSAHWTVYSVARSKVELKMQLCVNSTFYLSIFCIVIGIGFFGTAILDFVSKNYATNYGVSLWGGALASIVLGSLLMRVRKSDPLDWKVSLMLAFSIIALVLHVITFAINTAAVITEFTSFNSKLVNACDPDPNSYYLGGQAGSSGANYNPNNPNYIQNCSPNNTNCNVDPNQYATANPAYWWATNKDTVFVVYTYYRQVFRFAYACDLCEMVMALQMIAADIALIVVFKYFKRHMAEVFGVPASQAPANRSQATFNTSQPAVNHLAGNGTAAATPSPPPAQQVTVVNSRAARPVAPSNGNLPIEQPIYANVHVNATFVADEPTYDNLKKQPPAGDSSVYNAPAAGNTSKAPANVSGSRSTINTTSGSTAGLSLASRSSRAPKGAVQTRAMLADEAPPQTLPLKRLNTPNSSKSALAAAANAPAPVRVGASSNTNRNSSVPIRHSMGKY